MLISMAILVVLVDWMDREKAERLLSESRYLVLTFLVCMAERCLMGFTLRLLLQAISIRIIRREMLPLYPNHHHLSAIYSERGGHRWMYP